VCKHVAAVLYGVGIRLDAKPELFFVLRQVDQAELLSSATAGTVSRARPAAGKRIAGDRLSEVFGIELEDASAMEHEVRGYHGRIAGSYGSIRSFTVSTGSMP
jgi:uncharacterized Zn finger protein